MGRILLSSFGSYGDVNPYVGLGLALRERGFEPLVATSPYYRSYVEEAGLAFHPVRPDVDPSDRETVARLLHPRRGPELLLREILFSAVRESYLDLREAAEGAELIVTHPLSFAAVVLAEERKLPWVSTVLAPLSFFSRHDFPVSPALPGLKKLDRFGSLLPRLLVAAARLWARRWPEPVYRLRAQLGLPRGGHPLREAQHSPHRVLALFSRLLAAPQPDWPPNVRITGHVFYNGPYEALDPELERFLSEGPPPIVFTLGSTAVQVAGDFNEQSVAAARRLGHRAVLLVGRDVDAPRLPLRDDTIAVEFAPHELLFPRAAAVVHPGGIGTTAQALRAGKPVLVVPFAYDQPDNAHRVARLGVARTLPRKAYRGERVAAELTELLERPAYRSRAEAVAAAVAGEGGAVAAAAEIEAVLDGHRRA